MLASSDAPPKLVELGQAEGIGTVYEDCVGVWDVESGFDDGCGQQQIGLVAVKP